MCVSSVELTASISSRMPEAISKRLRHPRAMLAVGSGAFDRPRVHVQTAGVTATSKPRHGSSFWRADDRQLRGLQRLANFTTGDERAVMS
jgi:hypothetical protein